MHDVEHWMDELRECRALGASEMGYDYMLTAIRGIATTFIQAQMDIADTGFDQSDKKGRWQKGYDTLMSWARRKILDVRSEKSSKMDVGHVGNGNDTGLGKGQFDPYIPGNYYPGTPYGMMALGKGFGKGQYGKGYNPGFNSNYKGGFKGGGKGYSGPAQGKGFGGFGQNKGGWQQSGFYKPRF